MLAILRLGLQDNTSDNNVRKCACLTAQFAFFSRADSGWLLLEQQVLLHDDTFSVNVSDKNVERIHADPLSRHTNIQYDPDKLFMQLQRKWQRIRRSSSASALYWLFKDADQAPTSSIITTWLRDIMAILGLPVPPGVQYSGHSLRRGGASAAHAIDVSLPRSMAWGLWIEMKMAMSNIDVSVMPTDAARLFFDNLIPEQG
jgi:hypothetical protein